LALWPAWWQVFFLAPKPGEETRRALKGYARKWEEDVVERAKEARAALEETIDRA
jgi:hypothetical protein